MDLLIPASGFATRMNGIPKFLLPVGRKGESLLETHVKAAEPYYENILVSSRPEFQSLLNPLNLSPKVKVFPMDTNSMSETIIKLIDQSESPEFAVIMPDTYFYDSKPYAALSKLKADVNVAVWQIRDSQRGKLGQVNIQDGKIVQVIDKDPQCNFPWFWGGLSFNRKFAAIIDQSTPHIGYAINPALGFGLDLSPIIQTGEYYDCGTPTEYYDLILRLR